MSGEANNVSPLRKPVECPNCGAPSNREAYPFCSKRCADIDLNRWFSGAYGVPSTDPLDGEYAHDGDEESGR